MGTVGEKTHKQHIEAAALFAIKNVPNIDQETLEKFLELVNITGNFGSISDVQLLQKMRLLSKYVPDICQYSLFIMTELLEIHLPISGAQDLLKDVNHPC
jgi:hypothetical protein